MPSPQQFRLRDAKVRDVETLVRHRRTMWENMGVKGMKKLDDADKVYRRWALKRLRDHSLLGWVIENRNGTIVCSGCLWLQPRQPSPGNSDRFQPYLLSMYTMPDYRGRGLASRIVREAVNWTKRKKYAYLRLHASHMGRGVYRNLGFKRTWEMRRDMPKH